MSLVEGLKKRNKNFKRFASTGTATKVLDDKTGCAAENFKVRYVGSAI